MRFERELEQPLEFEQWIASNHRLEVQLCYQPLGYGGFLIVSQFTHRLTNQ